MPFKPLGDILGDPGQRFKFKDLTWLGGVKHLGRVAFGRVDMVPGGIKKASDLTKASRIIRAGGTVPTESNDLRMRLSLDLLGVKYRYILGYRGVSKAQIAMFQNEVDFVVTTIQAYRLNVEPANKQTGKNVVTGLWHFPLPDGKGGFHNNPLAKDLPSFTDVYKEVHGKAPSGIRWETLKAVLELHGSSAQMLWAPPGLPKDKTDILRKGIFDGMRGDGFRRQVMKAINMLLEPVPTPTGLMDVERVYKVPPEIVEFLKQEIDIAVKGN